MATTAKKVRDQNLDRLMSIPIQSGLKDVMEKASKQERRSEAAWVRELIYKELQNLGLIDGELEPTK